jgi:hypothetical protein
MNEMKKEMIKNAGIDIVEYLDEKYAIDVDLYDIIGLININLGFIFDVIEDLKKERNNS